eukprot:CAMPEP_0195307806 /NCGR_PEP_ID=MMETSP0707-20130614/37902_1 /TAXON_ID=33640 /ORGANISM="Asterionellopsis glacialis, Strain CCMP134" /LENGTH=561 /DNA_ID=CAMNT_0040372059 /DNA_START=301 /DNA_END=1987 /DNA_ORIENTATION=-
MNSNEKNVALEIEQKFALDNGGSVEKRLKELGLQEKGCVTMVDWYFDLPAPRWSLAPKDCWLRYREKEKKGTWELKRGGRHEEGGATLYEEIEGLNGFNMALSALPSTSSAEANVDELPTRFDGLTGNSAVVFGLSPIKCFHLISIQSSSWANISSTTATNRTNRTNANTSDIHFSESCVALEIEQKFALDDRESVEKRLKELGLQEKGCVTMVDWYFDLPAPRWSLAPKDCWLRYREKEKKGTWELKRGGRHEEGGATLYEEIEGLNGFNMALSALPSTSSAEANVDELPTRFDGLTIPPLPVSCALVPFARIESRRSTWYFAKTKDDSSGPFHDLTVVIDITDFGHMVGEVEAVVYDEKDVPGARERIGKLIVEIAANGPSVLGVGKLEHYLMINEPDLYEIYVKQDEEIEGLNGFNMALSALPSTSSAEANVDDLPTRFDGLTIPPLPVSCALVPFARIETRRSTWYFPETTDNSSEPFHDLIVDLDGTNFGHMVGEVEAVVYDEKDVPGARERIAKLIAEITENESAIGVGKLEYYLMKNEPKLYEACLKSGVISKK